jgi:hypothetical protein
VLAYAVDEALALRLLFDEQRARSKKPKGEIPPGQRYETPADVFEAARPN